MTIEQLRELVTVRKTQRDLTLEEIETIENEIKASGLDKLEEAGMVLEKLSEKQRLEACEKLEGLCTFALQYSMSDDLEAKIEVTRLRGKPAAQLYIVNKKTGVMSTPIDSNGGGIVDIVSTALRYIVAEVWTDPEIDGPIILDEAYKHLSKEYTPLIADFLKKISVDFDRQTIMSTHNDYISQTADNIIGVSLDDAGRSKIAYLNEVTQ